MQQPLALTLDIMELRQYQRAKTALDQAKNTDDVPVTPMVEMVWLIENEIMRRKRAKNG